VAVDDVVFSSGDACKGHCTFDSGLCHYTNGSGSDFQWSVVSQ
jgi:hypothetical protein